MNTTASSWPAGKNPTGPRGTNAEPRRRRPKVEIIIFVVSFFCCHVHYHDCASMYYLLGLAISDCLSKLGTLQPYRHISKVCVIRQSYDRVVLYWVACMSSYCEAKHGGFVLRLVKYIGSVAESSPVDDIEIIWCGRRKCSCHMSHNDSHLSIVSPARNKLFGFGSRRYHFWASLTFLGSDLCFANATRPCRTCRRKSNFEGVRETGSSNGLEDRQHDISFHTRDIISAWAVHEKITFRSRDGRDVPRYGRRCRTLPKNFRPMIPQSHQKSSKLIIRRLCEL